MNEKARAVPATRTALLEPDFRHAGTGYPGTDHPIKNAPTSFGSDPGSSPQPAQRAEVTPNIMLVLIDDAMTAWIRKNRNTPPLTSTIEQVTIELKPER